MRPLGRERLPFAHENGHGRRKADPVDTLEVEQAAEEDAELVRRARALGGEPPVVDELASAIEAERGLRVADVDGEEHRASESERCARRATAISSSPASGCPSRSARASAVSRGSSPSPRSSSTVTSPDVYTSARGMIRLGRLLSQTHTSSMRTWKNG